jgi:hypothetical protein
VEWIRRSKDKSDAAVDSVYLVPVSSYVYRIIDSKSALKAEHFLTLRCGNKLMEPAEREFQIYGTEESFYSLSG